MGEKTNNENLIQRLQDQQARDRAELDNLRTAVTGYQIKVENQADQIAGLEEDNEAMAEQVRYWRKRTAFWRKQAS